MTGMATIHLTHQNHAVDIDRAQAALQGHASEEEKQDSHPQPGQQWKLSWAQAWGDGWGGPSAPKSPALPAAIRAASLGAPPTPSGPPCMA